MLEDGEIDEEDLDVPTTVEPDQINPNYDVPNDQQNNKRKNRESKLNKRKKHAKSSKTGHKNGLHIPDIESNDDDSNHSEGFQYESRRQKSLNIDRDERTSHSFNNGNKQPTPLLSTHPPSLLGLTTQKPKSLMSATHNPSSWSNPPSKKENAPKSLFDLFVTPSGSMGTNSSEFESESKFVDPIITEKENNKPSKFQLNKQRNGMNNESKRKSDDEAEGNLISIESIEKKMEKKRKYSELHKEKLKKQEQNPKPVREPIICKFFLEGRCQKGTDCPFSHNTVLNKKLEPCKFFLNGFCAKNENCLFMHGEFPCKFFHRKNGNPNKSSCIHGDQCRFSHEPITDPLLLEAFNKHVSETSHNNNTTELAEPQSTTSILGSPPRTLTPLLSKSDERPPSLMSLMSVNIPKKSGEVTKTISPLAQHPSSPPPASNSLLDQPSLQQNIPFKKTLLATPTDVIPSLLNNSILPTAFGGASVSQDVDERSVAPPKAEPKIPLLNSPSFTQSGDIDERAMMQQIKSNQVIENIDVQSNNLTEDTKTESLKQELIIKIMKSIADGDSGNGDALSQLPKQTLTELLVKLLNDKDNLLGTDVILNLLATLSVKQDSKDIDNEHSNSQNFGNDDEQSFNTQRDSLNESSSNLQIDLNTSKKSLKNGSRKREDDHCSDYDIDDEYDHDEDDEENGLIIEGTLEEEMKYKLIELDIEPSKLWTDPPVASEFSPGILNLTGLTDQQDQECDPRIKYYQDKSNCLNISNYQKQLIEQNQAQLLQLQQQNTPTSPLSSSNTTSSIMNNNSSVTITEQKNSSQLNLDNINDSFPVLSKSKNRIVDPRLKKNLGANNNSPTRSISPTQDTNTNSNDLISIQTRQLAGSSLLSALPDLQFPKDIKNSNIFNSGNTQSQSQDTSTVKLSIEDYKRKLQKNTNPSVTNKNLSNSITNSTMSILNSLASNSPVSGNNQTTSNNNTNSNSNSLPSIPSYSVNLQAPQSLHELLRNFQSS